MVGFFERDVSKEFIGKINLVCIVVVIKSDVLGIKFDCCCVWYCYFYLYIYSKNMLLIWYEGVFLIFLNIFGLMFFDKIIRIG